MSKKHRGGTLADIGCHILDCAAYAAGDIRRISCHVKSFDKGVPRNTWKGYRLDADDSFFVTAEFAAGAVAVIHATRWATGHNNSLRLRIFGDKGSLAIDTDVGWNVLQVCLDKYHSHHALWNTIPSGLPRVTIYERFIRSIRSGRAEPPTFEDGAKIQAYLDACRTSSSTGRPVTVRS